MFQKRIVPSFPPVIRVLPSGEKATDTTACLCPAKSPRNRPAETSHNAPILLRLTAASKWLSGEKAAFNTQSPLLGHWNTARWRRVATSQTIVLPRSWVVARQRPSGEKATGSIVSDLSVENDRTRPLANSQSFTGPKPSALYRRKVASYKEFLAELITIVFPSGEKSILRMWLVPSLHFATCLPAAMFQTCTSLSPTRTASKSSSGERANVRRHQT